MFNLNHLTEMWNCKLFVEYCNHYYLDGEESPESVWSSKMTYVVSCSHLLIAISSSTNFLIYCYRVCWGMRHYIFVHWYAYKSFNVHNRICSLTSLPPNYRVWQGVHKSIKSKDMSKMLLLLPSYPNIKRPVGTQKFGKLFI